MVVFREKMCIANIQRTNKRRRCDDNRAKLHGINRQQQQLYMVHIRKAGLTNGCNK